MKRILFVIILGVLLCPIVSVLMNVNVQGVENENDGFTTITVGVNRGKNYHDSFTDLAVKPLNDYEWIVDNSKYKFCASTMDIDYIESMEEPYEYDVLIFDGMSDEQIKCSWFGDYGVDPGDASSQDIKDKLEEFITYGNGYIGKCGSGQLAATYDEAEPDNIWEYYFINANSFLSQRSDIKLHTKLGDVGVSQFFGMKYDPLGIPRIILRDKQDPGAAGVEVYVHYGTDYYPKNTSNSEKYSLSGVWCDLINLNTDHPIFNGYLGGSLYTNMQSGGVYPNPPEDVDVIADLEPCMDYDPTEQQFVNIWEFIIRNEYKPELLELVKWGFVSLILSPLNNFKFEIPIVCLPTKWQNLLEDTPEWNDTKINFFKLFIRVIQNWKCWKDTYEKAETEYFKNDLSPPAIIAFEYGDGRIILSGAHTASRIMPLDVNAEIRDNDEDSTYQSLKNGLYHWYNVETNEKISKADLKENPDNYWYLRREAAWAAPQVPDNHLPPVYGRSEVKNFENTIQTSDVFDVTCCVGKEKEEDWSWDDLTLTLKYKWNNINVFPEEGDWIEYQSIEGPPFKFTFDSPEGSGFYWFCSTSEVNGETEDDPPLWDAYTAVDISISSYFDVETAYLYANSSVIFNSSKSATIWGTNITSYDWQFGDSKSSTLKNPTHIFTEDGVYNITLIIQNDATASDSFTRTITVHNNPPIAEFEQDKIMVFADEQINFTDNSSDKDGNLSQWLWDFGDNSESSVQNTNHTYSQGGYYDITLKVTDDDNYTTTSTGHVFVIDSLVNQSKTQQGNIWNKIQDAVDNSSEYDIIYIENGTYSEDIIFNKTITLIGEDRDNVVITGQVDMINPRNYELPDDQSLDLFTTVNMTCNELLMHFNNDSDIGENYYNLDLVYDHSGQGNNGTLYGATWTTNALKGEGAFDFNGNSNSINLTGIPSLMGENVTASAWVFWEGGSGSIDPIVSQSDVNEGYCLYINSSSGKPVFRLDNDNVISSVSISSNEWHHIVGTHNNTVLKIYVDGILQGNHIKSGSGLERDCYIGFDNLSSYFKGIIDEIAVWNYTLPDDEIKMIYDSNYGICINGVTIRDSDVGIAVCNHSEISNCLFVNNTVAISMNNSCDIRIYSCNITNATTGISIVDSNQESFYYNLIVNCYIDDVTSAIVVNNSTNLFLVGDIVNGSCSNLSFSDCDFDNITVMYCDSPNNMAPDTPYLNGPTFGDINVLYSFSTVTNDTNDDQIEYWFDWGDGNNSGWLSLYVSNQTVNVSHTWVDQGGYYVRVKAKDIFDNETAWSEPILFKTENLPPLINSVNNSPGICGFGTNITILVNATDDACGNQSGIQYVKVNITYPDDSYLNKSMAFIGNDTYRYVFSDTWTVGWYNYSIWAVDDAYNSNGSTGYSFNVSSQATIKVCTIMDEYGSNEIINITDPPSESPLIGFEMLDNGEVLHIWNCCDSYYFDTDNGIQLTNHYDKYWSHNVLMLGYYNNDQWNLIYRTDELSGFNKNITSDNETYVNATLWKDLTYMGYNFRLAIRYHLGIDDNELTVVPYIKNLGQNIPYILGFAWEINDIQVDMTTSGDYIEINDTVYDLNDSLDLTFTNMTLPIFCWDNTTNETYICDYTAIPYFYIREDLSENTGESLYLRWNESLDYKVTVKSVEGEYNAPVTLGVKIGKLNAGQEKYTTIFWHDAYEITYYFNAYHNVIKWATNPVSMVDNSTSTFASTTFDLDVQICNENTCSGSYLGTISKVEVRCHGKRYGSGIPIPEIRLRPLGDNHVFYPTSTPAWSSWYDITHDNNAPDPWTWNDIDNLDCEVESKLQAYTLYCSKVEIRVTYTRNDEPVISNPYPSSGSNGIVIQPNLNITVSDHDGDNMNITWLSNSSGSWQVFGTNNSVGNGTYHQTLVNASVNGQWWYWKVNVSDGTNYSESSVFYFYSGYESKIKNTGSTNIKGYLLMQVQFYNNTWVVADDTINETTLRTINSSTQLGLDTIFNGLVNTSNLSSYGNGTYRIYAAFRDPDGNILVGDDETELIATYEFTITYD